MSGISVIAIGCADECSVLSDTDMTTATQSTTDDEEVHSVTDEDNSKAEGNNDEGESGSIETSPGWHLPRDLLGDATMDESSWMARKPLKKRPLNLDAKHLHQMPPAKRPAKSHMSVVTWDCSVTWDCNQSMLSPLKNEIFHHWLGNGVIKPIVWSE